MDYQASLASYLDMVKSLGGSDALDKTAVDDELVSLVPAWFGSVGRFESDALVASSAFPRSTSATTATTRRARCWAGRRRTRSPTARSTTPAPRSPRCSTRFRKLPEAKQVASTRSTRRPVDRPRRDLRLVGRHGARRLGGLRRHARRRPRHQPRPTRRPRRPPSDYAPRAARDRRRPGRDQAPRRPARRRDDHRRRLQRRPRHEPAALPGRLQAGARVHVHRPTSSSSATASRSSRASSTPAPARRSRTTRAFRRS